MAPVLLTLSDAQTAETKEMMRAGADEETVAGFLIGQLDELPDLVTPYVEAGVDEVIISLPFGSPDDIRSIGKSSGRCPRLRRPKGPAWTSGGPPTQ